MLVETRLHAGYLLHAGYRVTDYWLPGYWSPVYGSTVGCWLRDTGWCGNDATRGHCFCEIAVGTTPQAEIQRYRESCQFTTERILSGA